MNTNGGELNFNALTDPWLPLMLANGTTEWASVADVLSGEKDGIDLDYPRDDFRIYARLLLSALVQALFPAATKNDLVARIQTPLKRADIDARISSILGDFDLFGATPFLQIVPPDVVPKQGAAPFVFPAADLYQPQTPVDAISLPVALVTIFTEQTYAGGAGRGYGAGPGGQPGVITMIDAGSVRRSAWANTLTLENVERRYPKDDAKAWSNEKRAARPRASIGLVGGIFFQPRSIWLVDAGIGRCSVSGVEGPLVKLSPIGPKSELSPKPSSGEDTWVRPWSPLAVNSQGIAPVRLNVRRPAWTGLAQLLDPVSKSTSNIKHPLEGPAPILAQWKALTVRDMTVRLLVLDFERDKANIKRRFFESFPLTHDLLQRGEVIERIRSLVEDAQRVESALAKSLTQAHDTRKAGGLAREDARASFWAASEAPFIDWLTALISLNDDSDADFQRAESYEATMRGNLRQTALAIFDAHAELSEFDPRKQGLVAKARRNLRNTLWPKPLPARQTLQSHEVTS